MKYIEIALEEFEDTALDKQLDRDFGPRSSKEKVYSNIAKTYYKYMMKHGSTNITILTNEVPEQIYKVAAEEIKIKNV